MTQRDRRLYLLHWLLAEKPVYKTISIPEEEHLQRQLLRSLFNVRPPQPADVDFLAVQDAYLQAEIRQKGITALSDLSPREKDLYLWQGDITTLQADAIVNAANDALLGCFLPCHACIDNTIHTYAGIQLRLACADIMRQQGCPEPTGRAKLTPAFNLPSRFVLHTVGPIIDGIPTEEEGALLASCYRSCLELADKNRLTSVAFCCISTGEFRFPQDEAARIAVAAVRRYKETTQSRIKVIFNVFKDDDRRLYDRLLASSSEA